MLMGDDSIFLDWPALGSRFLVIFPYSLQIVLLKTRLLLLAPAKGLLVLLVRGLVTLFDDYIMV